MIPHPPCPEANSPLRAAGSAPRNHRGDEGRAAWRADDRRPAGETAQEPKCGLLNTPTASGDYKRERWGRHSKRLDAMLLATVNMPAKDEPLPHCDFDRALGGEWNDHRDWARIRRLPKSVIPGRPVGAGPEPMNTCNSNGLVVLCSWVPDSRAAPALRNDRSFGTSCQPHRDCHIRPRILKLQGIESPPPRWSSAPTRRFT